MASPHEATTNPMSAEHGRGTFGGVENGRAVLPPVLQQVLHEGAVAVRLHPQQTSRRSPTQGDRVYASDRFRGNTAAVAERTTLAVATDKNRNRLTTTGTPEEIVVSPFGGGNFGHNEVVDGGRDEPAQALSYTTASPMWGHRGVEVTYTVAVPASLVPDAVSALENPTIRHAFLDQVVDHAGVPAEEWQGTGHARPLRPNFPAWASMNNGESPVLVDTNYTPNRRRPTGRIVTAALDEPPPAPVEESHPAAEPRRDAAPPRSDTRDNSGERTHVDRAASTHTPSSDRPVRSDTEPDSEPRDGNRGDAGDGDRRGDARPADGGTASGDVAPRGDQGPADGGAPGGDGPVDAGSAPGDGRPGSGNEGGQAGAGDGSTTGGDRNGVAGGGDAAPAGDSPSPTSEPGAQPADGDRTAAVNTSANTDSTPRADSPRTETTADRTTVAQAVHQVISKLTDPYTSSGHEATLDEQSLARFAETVEASGINVNTDYPLEAAFDLMELVEGPEEFTTAVENVETRVLISVLRQVNEYEMAEGDDLDGNEQDELAVVQAYLTAALSTRPQILALAERAAQHTPEPVVAEPVAAEQQAEAEPPAPPTPAETAAAQVAPQPEPAPGPAPEPESGPAPAPPARREPQVPAGREALAGMPLGDGTRAVNFERPDGTIVNVTYSPRGDGTYDVIAIEGLRRPVRLEGVSMREAPTAGGGNMIFFETTATDEGTVYFVDSRGRTNIFAAQPGAAVARRGERYPGVPDGRELELYGAETPAGVIPIYYDVNLHIRGLDGQALPPYVVEAGEETHAGLTSTDHRQEFWDVDPVVARVLGLGRMAWGEVRHIIRRRGREFDGWSTAWSEREYRIPPVGAAERRIILGESRGHLIAAPDGAHVTAYGPTGSGKSESVIMPNILNHKGNMVSTAVDPEIYLKTAEWARSHGDVWLFDPFNLTGDEHPKHVWNPLTHCRTWSEAREFAHDLIVGSQPSQAEKSEEYWYQQAEGMLAPLLYINANSRFGSMKHVLETVLDFTKNDDNSKLNQSLEWLGKADQYLRENLAAERAKGAGANIAQIEEWLAIKRDLKTAFDKLELVAVNISSGTGGDNVQSSVTFAENAMKPWDNPEVVAATSGDGMLVNNIWGNDDPDNNPSLYIVAPEDKQEELRGLFTAFTAVNFRAMTRHGKRRRLANEKWPAYRKALWTQIDAMPEDHEDPVVAEKMVAAKKAAQQAFADEQPPPMKQGFMALDEAGTIAAIPSLPSVFALARKQLTQLLLVFQDRGQILSTYGEHGTTTIESNSNGAVGQLWNAKDFAGIRTWSEGMGDVVTIEKRRSEATTQAHTTTTVNADGTTSRTHNPSTTTNTVNEERVVKPRVAIKTLLELPKHTAMWFAGKPIFVKLISAKKHISTRHRYGMQPSGLRPSTIPENQEAGPLVDIDAYTQEREAPRPAITYGGVDEVAAGGQTTEIGKRTLLEIAGDQDFAGETTIEERQAARKEARDKQRDEKQSIAALAQAALDSGHTLPAALPKGKAK